MEVFIRKKDTRDARIDNARTGDRVQRIDKERRETKARSPVPLAIIVRRHPARVVHGAANHPAWDLRRDALLLGQHRPSRTQIAPIVFTLQQW